MNSITAEIINLIIFILVFLVLYFNLIDNNLYLKNFLIVLVIGYFGVVDLKYGLLLFVLFIIDVNNKEEQENFYILKNIKSGINKVRNSMANLGKKPTQEEEQEEQENFYVWDKVFRGKKKKPVQEEAEESRPDIQEDFISLKSISDSIGKNETFKSWKNYAKKGARNILKSIQEEEAEALPENEEEQEEEEDDDIENFTVRDKKKQLKRA